MAAQHHDIYKSGAAFVCTLGQGVGSVAVDYRLSPQPRPFGIDGADKEIQGRGTFSELGAAERGEPSIV